MTRSTHTPDSHTPADGAERLDRARPVPLLDGRPPLEYEGLRRARLVVLLFRPLVCLWLVLRQRRLVARINAKLDLLADCRDAEQIRQLIGEPVYAVRGETCDAVLDDGTGRRPDRIECYEWDGCCIDVWYKNDRILSQSGFVKPTVWDFVLAGNQPQEP